MIEFPAKLILQFCLTTSLNYECLAQKIQNLKDLMIGSSSVLQTIWSGAWSDPCLIKWWTLEEGNKFMKDWYTRTLSSLSKMHSSLILLFHQVYLLPENFTFDKAQLLIHIVKFVASVWVNSNPPRFSSYERITLKSPPTIQGL